MNEKENRKRLKQTMALLKIKIENLKPHIEESDRLNKTYNQLLIEKAIIKDELDRTKPNFLDKFKKLFKPRNKKLISDYFN